MTGAEPGGGSDEARYLSGMERLIAVVQELSLCRDLAAVTAVVRVAARELSGADGATFVLREGEQCHYVDEDAIGPLWKGRRFPMSACASGWAMSHQTPAVIEDIYQDERIPIDAYAPTFVRSLVIVPIRVAQPIGAIGAYWARTHRPGDREVRLLQSLADSASIALENVQLYGDLRVSLGEARDARDEARRQLELRDEFISIAAHELNTPLTPLTLQLQLQARLLESPELAEGPRLSALRRAGAVSLRQVGELRRLADDLLDASRVMLGRLALSRAEAVDLGAIVTRVVAARAPAGLVEVEAGPGVIGRFDEARIEQVVRCLLSNALKFGAGRPVSVTVARDGQRALLTVRDRGIGIAVVDQPRLFQRFERASSLQSYGGVGLGLYLARQIVEGHGGAIGVTSEPGQGATFSVSLPLGGAAD